MEKKLYFFKVITDYGISLCPMTQYSRYVKGERQGYRIAFYSKKNNDFVECKVDVPLFWFYAMKEKDWYAIGTNIVFWNNNMYAQIQSPPPLKRFKAMGFLSNNGPDSLKITKPPSQHLMLDHYRLACETFRSQADGGPLKVVFGSSLRHSTAKKSHSWVGSPLTKLSGFLDPRMIYCNDFTLQVCMVYQHCTVFNPAYLVRSPVAPEFCLHKTTLKFHFLKPLQNTTPKYHSKTTPLHGSTP